MLTDQYNKRYFISSSVIRALSIGGFQALADALQVSYLYVFDESGATVVTNSSYSNFMLSEDPSGQSYEFRKLLHKTTLPPDACDCSSRKESEQGRRWSAMAQKAYSLSRTKWLCKRHIVLMPKYRRKVICNQIREDAGRIPRKLREYKGFEVIEGHLMPDHVRMLASIPPKHSVPSVMGYLRGKSSLMAFDKHANLK